LEVDLAAVAVEEEVDLAVAVEVPVVSAAAVVADRLVDPVDDRPEDRPDEDVPREDEAAAAVDTTTATVLRAGAAVGAVRGEAIPMGPRRC
jgi:hypothetical protein